MSNQLATTTDKKPMVEIYRFCTGCKQHRLIDDFALNVSTRDGYSKWCKPCHRADGAKRRQNAAYRALQDRLRKEWSQSPRGKELIRQRAARERQRHPEKISARNKSRVLQSQPCKVCGTKAEKHHPDYSQPLLVVWLCKKHHTEIHHG